jgi:hypothetical protein
VKDDAVLVKAASELPASLVSPSAKRRRGCVNMYQNATDTRAMKKRHDIYYFRPGSTACIGYRGS